MTGSGYLARIILSVIFLLVVGIIFFQQLNWLQGKSSPVEQGRKTLTACYTITLAFLLSTPTLQPWYALNLAVFLPFCAGPAGLIICWVVFLTYQVQIHYFIMGKWVENQYVSAALFLAPVTAWLIVTGYEKIRQANSCCSQQHL
ncbi:MAG: hypothetical protein WCG31_10070 [Deltaproteobacteria bacterium]